MFLVDIVAHYIYLIKVLLVITAIIIIVSGLDDLFIDLVYWSRTIRRKLSMRHKYKPLDIEQLYIPNELPFAVMIPAWQEDAVIAQMIENTLRSYDYRNYHMFIGAYQNDPATQAEARRMCALYPTVHLVIVPRDGPTCKADCLNWLVQGVMLCEQQNSMRFAGIVMHDAEDVVHRLELKLFNYLIERMDMMQLPVFPLELPWYKLVGSHYIDEFAESHSKDMMVREYLTGAIPSAGVATCFSRRAIDALAAQNNNTVFNTDSLTEDYDIGFRLKSLGMKQIFLRYGIMATVRRVSPFTGEIITRREREFVATREFFPDTIRTATRQKARWILGIVFQGWRFIGWQGNLATRYMLFRDRKAVFTAFATFVAYLLLLHIVLLNVFPLLFNDAYLFPTLINTWSFPWWLIMINFFFLMNRILHRVYFTGQIYGWEQALLSIPRMVVSNIIAFLASLRALRQFLAHRASGKPMVWDKTAHAYPSTNQLEHMRQRLGELLLERKLITQLALTDALARQKHERKPLGELLLDMKKIELQELAHVLAQHMSISVEEALAQLQTSKERE
ncbi:MAG: glycosyl transferase family protein [Rickettsiales bacterium]